MKRTPLRSKGKPYKPAAVRRHHDRVAQLPCLVCERTPVHVHHVTGYADRMGRLSRDDLLVVPLCPAHHLHDYGLLSVERLGHRGFWLTHGIDLLAEAVRLRDESLAMERDAA